MAKIGIMGGTFDPVHVGHLMLAEYARSENGLDKVWLLPTGCSYMKSDKKVSDSEDRLNMVKLSIEGENSCLDYSDMEIKRSGYTYTYETVMQLKQEYPEHEFTLIYGADCLFDFEKWKCFEKIFEGCHIVVALRHDSDLETMERKRDELQDKYGAHISLMPFVRMELSSTLIRNRVKDGKSIRFMVTDPVVKYIEEKGLYKDENR